MAGDEWKAPPPRQRGSGQIAAVEACDDLKVTRQSPDDKAAALACLWRWAITVARSGVRRGVTVDRIRLSLWAHVWAVGWTLGLSPLDRRMVAGDVLAQLRAEVSA